MREFDQMDGPIWLPDPNKLARRERLRAARKLGTHTRREWLILRDLFGFCLECGRDDCQLEADHIVPLFRGGSDGLENIQPLCRKCNASKSATSIDWRPLWMPDWGIRLCLLLDTRPGYGVGKVADIREFGFEIDPIESSGCRAWPGECAA